MKKHYPVPTGSMSDQKRHPPLALVEVGHANKMELFEESISACKEAIPQTQDMLARLRKFQPSVAQLFQPKRIAISQAPLRLLCEGSKQLEVDSPQG